MSFGKTIKIDKNSQEYWDNILEKEWEKNIDKEEWFYEEDIIKDEVWKKNSDIDDILNLWLNFSELSEKFWKEKNINIISDLNDKKIEFFDKNNSELIWKICAGIYHIWNVDYSDHLYIKVEEEYLNKGFWRMLFCMYKKMGDFLWLNLIPYNEYSRKASRVVFSMKNWYFIKWKIVAWLFQEFTADDLKEIEKNVYNFKNWNVEIEDELAFDVVLKKDSI